MSDEQNPLEDLKKVARLIKEQEDQGLGLVKFPDKQDNQVEQAKQIEEEPDQVEEEVEEEQEDEEPIEPILNLRRRTNSLQGTLSDLKRQEEEMKLKLKIMATKEKMARMQKKIDEQAKEDSFYNDFPDREGYRRFRNEKWEREFEDLVVRLKEIEDAETAKSISVEDATEAKKIITKEIKHLKSIKSSVNMKNKMNKFRRGMQKVLKGAGSFSKEMGKLGDSMGKMGTGQNFGGEGQQFENYFSDRKTASTTTTKRRRKSRKSSKSKTKKRRRKSRRRTTQVSEPSTSGSGMGDFFKGI